MAADYAQRKSALLAALPSASVPHRLAKRTSSNLFRYASAASHGHRLDLSGFNHCLALDAATGTLDVEGLATFEQIVDCTLPRGLVPRITPELKHITIGGAAVGIGIESNCFRFGFVHDSVLEAEVLLPGKRVVVATPDGEYADLLRGLPNSYGTLGYILRARIKLMPAAPYVHLMNTPFDDLEAFLSAMRVATEQPDVDFVEGTFYDEHRLFLTVARFVEQVPRVDDILREHVFYKLIQRERDVYVGTKDYLFRYDPEWFWNIPDTPFYRAFRRYAPAGMRNSGFYKRYTRWKHTLCSWLPWRVTSDDEPLIQDWEVPWDQAAGLTRFAVREVDLRGRPWIVTPIRTSLTPTLYPVRADTLYYNLGCYCQVKRRPERGPFWYTKIMDRECFGRGGIKMLYSSTFLPKPEFDRIYNGAGYAALKRRYDPDGMLGDLYAKCALR